MLHLVQIINSKNTRGEQVVILITQISSLLEIFKVSHVGTWAHAQRCEQQHCPLHNSCCLPDKHNAQVWTGRLMLVCCFVGDIKGWPLRKVKEIKLQENNTFNWYRAVSLCTPSSQDIDRGVTCKLGQNVGSILQIYSQNNRSWKKLYEKTFEIQNSWFWIVIPIS